MIAMKILETLFLSIASFVFACLFVLAIAKAIQELSEECSPWFSVSLIRFLVITIATLILLAWFTFNFVMWGKIWFKVSGPANVPHWAIVLFSDGGR